MKKTLSILSLLLVLVQLFSCTCAEESLSPSEEFYVYDEANVLSDETHDYIVEKNERLASLTGAQIVVMTVETTGDEEMDDYATRIFNAWGIGDEEEDNGVLLLLSIEEDDYWVLQGQGLEEILSSGILKLMLNEHMEPHFSLKDYDGGVRETFDALLNHLESAYSITIAEGTEADTESADEDAASADGYSYARSVGLKTLLKRLFRRAYIVLFTTFAFIPLLLAAAILVVVILLSGARRRRPVRNRPPHSARPWIHTHPGRGSVDFTPPPGGFGGPRPTGGGRAHTPAGGFGASSHRGGFGGSHPGGFGGSHSSGSLGGGSHHTGGGGHSRGGGAGRR